GASGYQRLRQVVSLDDGDTGHADHVTTSVRTLTAPVAVQNLGGLRHRVELSGTDEQVPLIFRHVLLVQNTGSLEHGLSQSVTVGIVHTVDSGTAELVFIVDGLGCTGSQNTSLEDVLVHGVGQLRAHLAGVHGANVVVVLR